MNSCIRIWCDPLVQHKLQLYVFGAVNVNLGFPSTILANSDHYKTALVVGFSYMNCLIQVNL